MMLRELPEQVHTAIIGAGPGGMYAAIALRNAGFEDRGDAGVVEACEHARLELESPLRVAREVPRSDDLEGNVARGIGLEGLVDDAHAAVPQLADDLVPGDLVGHGGARAFERDRGR